MDDPLQRPPRDPYLPTELIAESVGTEHVPRPPAAGGRMRREVRGPRDVAPARPRSGTSAGVSWGVTGTTWPTAGRLTACSETPAMTVGGSPAHVSQRSDALGQPKKEPSREELEQELFLCRRDELLATRSSTECDQALAYTDANATARTQCKTWPECRKRLDAAQATLKAAQKRARATRKRRLTK